MEGALRGTRATPFQSPITAQLDQTKVPDVSGMSVRQARQQLQDAGFTVQVSPRSVDSDRPRGTVAYTSPTAGGVAEQDTAVMIFVSDGNGQAGPRKKKPGHRRPFN